MLFPGMFTHVKYVRNFFFLVGSPLFDVVILQEVLEKNKIEEQNSNNETGYLLVVIVLLNDPNILFSEQQENYAFFFRNKTKKYTFFKASFLSLHIFFFAN